MQTHYFIGINVPAPVASQLAEMREGWGLNSHKKYTAPHNMHITLLFIGSADEVSLRAAARALEDIKIASFDLTIEHVKTFGNPKTPRIIYAALAESAPLMELQEKIKKTVESFDISLDQKPFVPHITLAAKWAGGAEMETDKLPELRPISFYVEEFTLFRIEPQNARKYSPQAVYQLQKGN